MKQKRKTKFIVLILFNLFLMTFCKDNGTDPIEYNPDALRVAGKYEAIKFIYPANDDGSLDILGFGGYIKVELALDFSVIGSWKVPEIKNLPGSGFEESFEGSYSVRGDTLQFHDFDCVIVNPQLFFEIKVDSLKGKMGGISPTRIDLFKIEELL